MQSRRIHQRRLASNRSQVSAAVTDLSPDQPQTIAGPFSGVAILATRSRRSPARSTHEFTGAIGAPSLRLGGAHGTKRALAGTYIGFSVRTEGRPDFA
jgi:hypothetical protein